MAFLRNDAINRVNLHYGIQALAQGAGATFFLVFLLRPACRLPWRSSPRRRSSPAGSRSAPRSCRSPIRWGLKPRPDLRRAGRGGAISDPCRGRRHRRRLVALVVVAAVGEVCYWLAYNAYFAAVGDTEHRGHQIGAREALVAVVGIVAPLLGAWALLTVGPRPAFAAHRPRPGAVRRAADRRAQCPRQTPSRPAPSAPRGPA